jgi:hypothetical protein
MNKDAKQKLASLAIVMIGMFVYDKILKNRIPNF